MIERIRKDTEKSLSCKSMKQKRNRDNRREREREKVALQGLNAFGNSIVRKREETRVEASDLII